METCRTSEIWHAQVHTWFLGGGGYAEKRVELTDINLVELSSISFQSYYDSFSGQFPPWMMQERGFWKHIVSISASWLSMIQYYVLFLNVTFIIMYISHIECQLRIKTVIFHIKRIDWAPVQWKFINFLSKWGPIGWIINLWILIKKIFC